jgi:hypothetical protein
MFIGGSTVKAIQGNKIVPGFGDLYLARTGYKSQQTDEPENPGRSDNLWDPVDKDRDYGAHGAFGDMAKSRSWQLWADTHRKLLAFIGMGIASLIGSAFIKRRT